MFYKVFIILLIITFNSQADFDQIKPEGITTDSWQNLKSVANEMAISSNDSMSNFQEVVSINENWAFVGAENDAIYGASSGSVHVFQNVNGKWIKHSKIIPHDGQLDDQFGSMVNVSKNSNTVAIAAKASRS